MGVELGFHRAPRCEPVVSLVRNRRAHLCPLSSFQNPARTGVDPVLLPHPSFGLSDFFLSFNRAALRKE